MPISTDAEGNTKTPTKTQVVSQYAKEGIQRKLTQILPCDFLIEIKGSELELYIPEYYKGKVIGKWGAAINELEKEIWLRIHVKTFNDLPLLDAKIDIAGGDRKNDPLIISLPEEYRNKTICLLVDDGLIYAKSNDQANILINNRETSNLIKKKGFVIVKTQN